MPTGCRQIKTDGWKWKTTPLGYAASADEHGGKVHLEFAINAYLEEVPYGMRVVAEADGPVLSAFLMPGTNPGLQPYYLQMALQFGGVREGRTIFSLKGQEESDGEAIVGGHVDELHPAVQHVWPSSSGHNIQTSGAMWAAHTVFKFEFAPWGGALSTVATAGPEHKQLTLHGSEAVWVGGDQYNGSSIYAYTPQKGAFVLVPKPSGTLDALMGAGTDGNHIVWIHSSGKLASNDPYTERVLMVAPYTMDETALAPTSLGNFPLEAPVITNATMVGCGYAAHHHGPGKTRLVRLSDGYWWELPSENCTPPDYTGDWCFGRPMVVTCDELFLTSNDSGLIFNLARIELSALGAPNPPT